MLRKFWLNIRLFFEGAVLSYKALFRWLRPSTYIASKIVFPLGQIMFFGLLGSFAIGGGNPSFFVIGNAVQIVAMSGIYGVSMSIGGDRWDGTLPYLFGTPANRLAMFVGRAFVHIIDGAFGVVIGLLWGWLTLGLDLSHTNVIALVLTILAATISASGMGLMLGCLSLVTLNVMFINNTVYFLLMIFSGANLDITKLPTWVQIVSQVMPLSRSISAARQVIAGAALADVAPLLAGDILIGLLYIFVGYSMFRWFEFQAKQRGSLEGI
jgi:ABC-2 type transport system permease protein